MTPFGLAAFPDTVSAAFFVPALESLVSAVFEGPRFGFCTPHGLSDVVTCPPRISPVSSEVNVSCRVARCVLARGPRATSAPLPGSRSSCWLIVHWIGLPSSSMIPFICTPPLTDPFLEPGSFDEPALECPEEVTLWPVIDALGLEDVTAADKPVLESAELLWVSSRRYASM